MIKPFVCAHSVCILELLLK